MVVPRNFNDSTVVTVLFMMGSGGSAGRFLLDFCSAFVRIHGEEQWGENTSLRGTSADRKSLGCEFSQPH